MKNKKLLVLSTLFLSFALTSCGESFPSYIKLDDGDNGEVHTDFKPYDNGKRIESISFKENDVSIDVTNQKEYQIEASFDPSDAGNPKLLYVSNNPEIASVDDSGKVVFTGPGKVSISVSSDTGVSSEFRIKGIIPASKISVAPHFEGGVTLDINDTKQFSIATEPENATEKDVTWSVTDKDGNSTEIASISESGLLTVNDAKRSKNVELYVCATSVTNPALTSKELIKINDERIYAESVRILKDKVEVKDVDVYLGDPVQLDAITTPTSVTNKVNWSSKDTSAATVEEGLVSAVKAPAETTVEASIDGLTSEVTINTKKINVNSVTLNETELVLNKSQEAQLIATVLPDNASFKDVVFSVSEGNEYVTVDDNGLVKAKYQSGTNYATVVASSKDDSDIFATCKVTVTNKVNDIEINNPAEVFYYGGEQYTLTTTATPFDCDAYDVTWKSSNEEIATITNQGVVTTNSSGLTGTVTFTATVSEQDIEKSIDVNVIKPVAPFDAGHQYLVGNRNFAVDTTDYDHASWNDSDYAKVMEECPDPQFVNQWVLRGVHLEGYYVDAEGVEHGDLFKFRSADWPQSIGKNAFSTKSLHMTEDNGNFYVENSEKYDLYYQDLGEGQYQIYVACEFDKDTYYLVGNRDFSSGTARGEAGKDTSWHDSTKAYALSKADDQYTASISFNANDEFKIRNDTYFNIALGTDEFTSKIAHIDETTGNIVINNDGKYDIYFKNENGVMTVYMHDYVKPVEFAWGIAGSGTDWELDLDHPFVQQSTPEADALFTYKLNGFEFAKGQTWKVKNTKGEWVSNIEGVVGFDFAKSTNGAFSLTDGNIQVETAGAYDITLNIFDKAEKQGDDFVSGVQIYATKAESPKPEIVPKMEFEGTHSEVVMEENKDVKGEYVALNVELTSDTYFYFTYDEVNVGFTNIKKASPASVNSNKAGHIAVAKNGNYDIFVDTNTIDGECIFIKAHETPITHKDYIINAKKYPSVDWAEFDMSQNREPEKESEYLYTGDFTSGDEFVVHMSGDTWYHFEDVKAGCLNYVKNPDETENIQIKVSGNYTIYADSKADEDGNHIWIKQNSIADASIALSDSSVKNMEMYDEATGEFVYIAEFDGKTSFHLTQGEKSANFANIKNDSPASVSKADNNDILITKAGTYEIYFKTEVIDGECIYIAEHQETVTVTFTINYGTEVGQAVYIVGDFCNWKPSGGIRGTWTEGNNWVFELTLPIDTVWEFKFVINSYDEPGDTAIRWESDPDRSYTFSASGSETFKWQTSN